MGREDETFEGVLYYPLELIIEDILFGHPAEGESWREVPPDGAQCSSGD